MLTIDNESGSLWTCNFNPFNLSDISYSLGPVYEPLMFVNTLQSGKVTPWLATAYTWSNGNKTLTFTIRNGVKWSDGKPMSAADVVFTFNLLKKYPALDLNSVWSVLSSVTQQGSDQVVMQFKTPAVPYFYYIADQIGIVPEHIWSTISEPGQLPGHEPGRHRRVPGQAVHPAEHHLQGQPALLAAGPAQGEDDQLPRLPTNDTANTYLANGQAQWGSQFIPSIQKFYMDKSPDYHYWFPPVANVDLFINLTDPLLKNVAVRQAMAYAINRSRRRRSVSTATSRRRTRPGSSPRRSPAGWTRPGRAFGNDYALQPVARRSRS